ncbi:MAG TPA: DciA family protein [Candidatus Babeliales bacterium]|jgi:hypothetical protein|nr:DciA family protein [Candidatus Babeliales bacterium]
MSTHIKKILDICLSLQTWQATLLKQWPEIIGPLAKRVGIEKIYENTLILNVSDSCLMQELYLLSDVLRTTINQTLDQPYIKQIRFKKATVMHARKKKLDEGASCKLISVRLTPAEQDILMRIHDPELRELLKAFCIRCHRGRIDGPKK